MKAKIFIILFLGCLWHKTWAQSMAIYKPQKPILKSGNGFMSKVPRSNPKASDAFKSRIRQTKQKNQDAFRVRSTKSKYKNQDAFSTRSQAHGAKDRQARYFSSKPIKHQSISDGFMQKNNKIKRNEIKDSFGSSSAFKSSSKEPSDSFSGNGASSGDFRVRRPGMKLALFSKKARPVKIRKQEQEDSFTRNKVSERKLRHTQEKKKSETGLFPKGVIR